MIAIETRRLTVRNFDSDDWRDLHEMIRQYQASEYAAYDHPWPTSPEGIQDAAAFFAGGDRFLAVCLRTTSKLIGFVALNGSDDSTDFNLGYCFNSDYHGAGYATEACFAVIEHAFCCLGARRVVTGTALANQPSCRLLARLGFRKTGESRGAFQKSPDGSPIEFDGGSFALLREEGTVDRAPPNREGHVPDAVEPESGGDDHANR